MFYKTSLLYIKISESTYLIYYQRNRDMILNRAKDYYQNHKEKLRGQARDKYRNLSENCKKENMEKVDIIISLKRRK